MKQQDINNQFDLKRILFKVWDHRFLFIISLIIVLLITCLYILLAAEKYDVGATILIKTETNNSYTNPNDLLNVYDILNPSINLQNELNIIQSSPIIKEVLKELGLFVSYYTKMDNVPKGFSFSHIDIYKECPFFIVYNEDHVQPTGALFYVKILNDKQFLLSADKKEVSLYNLDNEKFYGKINNFSINGKYKFGEQIQNDNLSFKLLLNNSYIPEKSRKKDYFFQFNDISQLVPSFKSSLKVESSVLEATTATITLKGNNIQKSIDFINGIISKYIEKNLEKKNYLAMNTIQYIDNQLSTITDTLIQTEQQLQNFQRNYNIMDVNEKSQRLYIQLEQLERDKDNTNRRLNLLQQMKAYFESNDDASSIIIPSSMGIDDPLLNNMIQELMTFNSEKEQIIQSDQLRNPRLQILNTSIGNLKQSISENIDFSISTTTRELQLINNQIRKINSDFAQLPQTQRRLLGIERQFNITQDVYTSLMEKRIQAQIAQASTLSDCEVIEPPQYLGTASLPKIILLGIALFLGLFLPASFIFVKEYFTDTINDPEDLNKIKSIKKIGELIEQKINSENVIMDDPTILLAESFRTIQSNIDFYLLGKKHKIILITSSLPFEGKSFCALNLATCFAKANNKTLLIRFDLRKEEGSIKYFGHQKLVGISNYLIKRATLDDIIIPTDIPNLDWISAGESPPNPVELLSSDMLKELMQQIKQEYDYIFIDTPPFGLVTDAFIIMKYADLSIYVARIGKITSKVLSKNLETIHSKELPNVFLLINSVQPTRSGYYKYTNYRYGKKKEKSKKRLTKVVKRKENISILDITKK